MLYDQRYEENIVLKREAYQNLLTEIKNYPIVDIDYVDYNDKDELHDNNIWYGYTNQVPCLKITYGDSRSKKGNIIFAKEKQNEIKELKKQLEELQYKLNTQRYNVEKFKIAFKENEKVKEDKITQLEQVEALWNGLGTNKENFLKACLALLVLPYELNYKENQGLIYDTNKLFDDVTNNYLTEPIKDIALYYENLTLEKDLNNIEPGDIGPYKAEVSYSQIDTTLRNGESSQSILLRKIKGLQNATYIDPVSGNITKVFASSQQKAFLDNIYKFITAYNLLVFYDTFSTAGKKLGLTEQDISEIWNNPEEQPENINLNDSCIQQIQSIINKIQSSYPVEDNEEIEGKTQWQAALENGTAAFNAVKTTTSSNLEQIVQNIQTVINANLNNLYFRIEGTEKIIADTEIAIEALKANIKQAEKEILDEAGDRKIFGYKYVRLAPNISFDGGLHDKNKEETYGNYDGATLKSNFTISKIENPLPQQQQPTSATLNTLSSSSNQASGTFRVTINDINTYEVPIKGFGNKSDQPINMSTSGTIGITSDSAIEIISKNEDILQTITLDGNIDPKGDIINDIIPSPNGNDTEGKNLGSLLKQWKILYTREAIIGNADGGIATIRPYTDDKGTLGTKDQRWNKVYATNLGDGDKYIDHAYTMEYNTIEEGNKGGPANSYVSADKGYFNTLCIDGNEISPDPLYEVTNGGTTAQFWRGGDTEDGKPGWSNTLTGNFIVDGVVTINSTNGTVDGNIPTIDSSLYSQGGAYFTKNVYGARVFNAVFNDYAEYRTTINLQPGRVVIDNDDGSLSCSSKRLQPGAQIISDTFGHSMGYTEDCQTPLAVAGRVLTYTYQDRNNYHAGMAVCSAPNGTVDIMTREEIKEYPDCIIGIVSEIPQYEEWGTDKVKVNNRIWIKIK